MIVPMKHVTLLCVSASREKTLEALRALELVHLNVEIADTERFRDAQLRLAANQRAQWALCAAHAGKPVSATPSATHHLTPEQAAQLDEWLAQPLPPIEGPSETKTKIVLALANMRQEMVNEADRLNREIIRAKPFGAFDTSLPPRLAVAGIPVTLFRAPPKRFPAAPEGAAIQRISEDAKSVYAVLIGNAPLPPLCEAVALPEVGLDALRRRHAAVTARAGEIEAALRKAFDLREELAADESVLKDQRAFINVSDSMREHDGQVMWITGWCPADKADDLCHAAKTHAWGILLRDPNEADLPPTLLRPPRWLRPIKALFQGLGISPGYREADVSLPFFAFFSIFFAMLVGDACYGMIFLALARWGRKKVKPTPAARAPFTLLTVFSIATIIWGALTNSWLGFSPKALEHPVSHWLGNPETGNANMMLVSFTLGVLHLSIARVWNAIALFPDTKFLAQIGWVGVLWFMYFFTGKVVGLMEFPGVMKPVMGVSILLIVLFMLKKHELKTQGIELGMLPLNIISCLGDIISYVRLFAVGLAGAKVASSFNDMATGLEWPLYLKIIPMLIILLIGHGLNFAMAGLGVLIHAVRLNTLEFSSHKGISWSGIQFNPFRKTTSDAPEGGA